MNDVVVVEAEVVEYSVYSVVVVAVVVVRSSSSVSSLPSPLKFDNTVFSIFELTFLEHHLRLLCQL